MADWLGFRLEEAAPYGALGLNFTDFTWRENNVRSGYCWWRNAAMSGIQAYTQYQQGKYASKVQKRTQI